MPIQGPKPGERRGGRKKGTPNKHTTAAAACESLGVNPFEFMAMVVKGDVPCNVCRQRLKTRVRGEHGKTYDRQCQSCKGDGWEKLSPDFRGKMAAELAGFLEPKKKAVEHSGVDGAALPNWVVTVVTAEEGKS